MAYGTNDWSKTGKSDFEQNCRGFYENLSRNYPRAKIFALTPIWCADCEKAFPFPYVAAYIRQVAESIPNMTVICGDGLLPHDTSLFSDRYLHPNDEGFAFYGERLAAEIRKLLG